MKSTLRRPVLWIPALLALGLLLLAPVAISQAWAGEGSGSGSGSGRGSGGGGGGGGGGGNGGGGEDGGGNGGGGGGRGGGGGESILKLRLNDAVGKPGGTVALVIRTYAARPLRQGRITVRVRRPASKALGLSVADVTQPARPLTFLRSVVFSANGDAVVTATANGTAEGQSVGVDFTSPSASVNAADGPLAVIYMHLDPAVHAGDVYALEVDPAATGLVDPAGTPVSVDPIPGELVVRAGAAPFQLGAEGDELAPGEVAELGIETREPFAVYGGRITLRYDPAAQAGPPQVTMDPRFGKGTFQVVTSSPGLLVVSLSSPRGTLNAVPGSFLAVALPTSPAAAPGWSSPVTIDPAQSWLLGKRNRRLPVTFESGTLAFR